LELKVVAKQLQNFYEIINNCGMGVGQIFLSLLGSQIYQAIKNYNP